MSTPRYKVGGLYCSPHYFIMVAKEKTDWNSTQGFTPNLQMAKDYLTWSMAWSPEPLFGGYGCIYTCYISPNEPFMVVEIQRKIIKVIVGDKIGWVNGEGLKQYADIQEVMS